MLDRAGNVAVHIGAPRGSEKRLDQLTKRIERLGGWLDGRGQTKDGSSSLSVYTVPMTAGFEAIQEACNDFTAVVTGGEWYYVNVYDPADDVTPLN